MFAAVRRYSLHAARKASSLSASRVPQGQSRGGWLERVSTSPPSGRGSYRNFRKIPTSPRRTGGRNIGIAIALLGGGYYVSHLERVPYTGRLRMMDTSRKVEVAIGEEAFEEILRQHPGQILPKDHTDSRRVRNIGVRIARAIKKERPELMEEFKWRFVVIHAPGVVNAVCAPGGKIVVFSGLLDVAPDDDALAAVMAHEISHAVLRHSAERMSFMKIIFVVQMLLYAIVDFGGITALLVNLVLDLPYSRKLEREADFVGLRLMTNACYNPSASPKVFKVLEDVQAAEGHKETRASNMLSSHPMFKDRIKYLERDVPGEKVRFGDQCRHTYPSFSINEYKDTW